MILRIDGVEFDVKIRLTREAEIKESDISGYMLNRVYNKDVLGTYMKYTVTFDYPLYDQSKYAALYEMLTQPVPTHLFVLPYNQSTVTLTATVEPITDEVLEFENGDIYWRACSFAIVGANPTKQMTLQEAIARGVVVLPPVTNPEVGDKYEWTGTTWQKVVET